MSVVGELFSALAGADIHQVTVAAGRALAPAVKCSVAHPVDELHGIDAVISGYLVPLVTALPDLERRPFVEIQDGEANQCWVAGTGYIVGTFSQPLFDIPPTGKALYLRYSELVRIEDGRIAECFLFPDFLDVMLQAGVYPLRASLGYSGPVMPPSTLDGLCVGEGEASYTAGTVELVMDMLNCLRRYDGENLNSMDLENYWHPDFMWYGPAGIGTTRGITGFRRHHQGPFLRAFPDRDVDHHVCTVASGDYAATGGWPHMHGTHSGSGWLGLPPTGKYLSLRVMDIWRREGDLLKENWVAIDIPHMLAQMGLDVFAQMRAIKTR